MRKFMMMAGLLMVCGAAQAEGGAERAREFQQAFKAEQQRLWGDDSKRQQQVEREKQGEKQADS